MRRGIVFSRAVFMVVLAFGTGCTFTQVPQVTPTVIAVTDLAPTDVPTREPSATATATPGATASAQPLVEPTDTPPPPTNTPLPTSTPGPFLHEINSGETLGFIVQQYGHDYSNDAINSVVRVNENIPNPDVLPPPGTIILVPRPTVVAVAEAADSNGEDTVARQQPTRIGDEFSTAHTVLEGESLIDIAQQYNTTLEIISQLNPDIGFFGCNFNNPSGGPNCIININIGQEVIVPAPTPTPTLSPTPSGDETATPTPTYPPPMIVYPPRNGIAQPNTFQLQWTSAGVLRQDEVYLIYIKDVTASNEQVNAFVTRSNSFEVPADFIPTTGQRHEFQWWVAVGRLNEQGQYTNVSGEPEINTFYWESIS